MIGFLQSPAVARTLSFVLRSRRWSAMSVSPRYHFSTNAPSSCDDLFRNTSRRWIFNERDRLEERYVKFRPTELQRIAGEVIDQDYCPSIVKLAEGGFNKVFLLLGKDGRKVIARIPNPVAGPSHYTTACEVATINFLRNVLNIPVPEILAYSSSPDNPVGAEYILMERVKGESLSSRWPSLTSKEIKDIMIQIAEMEKKIFDFSFPAYGSLYHQKDLDGERSVPLGDDFCIGPVSARQFWHGERSKAEIDRGPWADPLDCLTSAARREIAINQHHAQPQPRRTFLLPTNHEIHPSEYTSQLFQFIQLAPDLIPPNPNNSCVATIRHPDLSLNNIFLEPGSTKILSIIDWQDAVVFPRFMQTGYPALCEHDYSRPQKIQAPSLPDGFKDMDVEEQRQCEAILRLEQANLYYTAATGLYNSEHMDILRLPAFGMRHYLIGQTGYPWDADLINLRGALVGITAPSVWSSISSAPCPVTFSNEEREAALAESKEWNESEQLLSRVREHLGIDHEGGTEPANFERAADGNRQFREEMVRQAEEGQREISWRNWPYKEDGDDSMPPEDIQLSPNQERL